MVINDTRNIGDRLRELHATDVRRLTGGASSLSYVATVHIGDQPRRAVVKVAPAGIPPLRNRDVLRQARLMKCLRDTEVPIPDVMWEDPGSPPEVPPLFVMSFVPGESFEPLFDAHGVDPPQVVANRMYEAARVLRSLHALDPDALGLADEPRLELGEEVHRWRRLLETIESDVVDAWEDVADDLVATEPQGLPPAVVHGDYRLGNLLTEGSAVVAVIDWEIWCVGDPRIDLGWFMINADPETYRRSTRYAGALPTPAELANAYAERAGQAMPALEWFQALACFKSVATWSLIVKNSRRRPAPDGAIENMAAVLPCLLSRARFFLHVLA